MAYDNEKPNKNDKAIAIIELDNEYKVIAMIRNYGIVTNSPPYSFSEFNNYLFYSSQEYLVQINIDGYIVERTIGMKYHFNGMLLDVLDLGKYIITDNIKNVKGMLNKKGIKQNTKRRGITLFKIIYKN